MVSIHLKSRIKPDGSLDLHVPTGLPESEVDVVLVLNPTASENDYRAFRQEFYGFLKDTPIEEPEELPYEVREPVQ